MTQAVSQQKVVIEQPNDEIVQEAIRQISHIATLPEVTLKIVNLVEDPKSTAQDLNKIITNDPALGARILKVVNSAFYGLPGQVASINRAIVLLGLNAVKNIAIAASLAKLFRGGQIASNFHAHDLWNHSIAVATGSRLLAQKAKMGLPDEAFLAGLIHDLGIMVEIQAQRENFLKVLEACEADPTLTQRQAEQQIIGADHQQFGAALCKSWKFPLSFIYVTGHHHDPLTLEREHRPLASIVHLADVMAAKCRLGYTGSVECEEFDPTLLEELNLTVEQVEEVSNALSEALEETKTLLQSDG